MAGLLALLDRDWPPGTITERVGYNEYYEKKYREWVRVIEREEESNMHIHMYRQRYLIS